MADSEKDEERDDSREQQPTFGGIDAVQSVQQPTQAERVHVRNWLLPTIRRGVHPLPDLLKNKSQSETAANDAGAWVISEREMRERLCREKEKLDVRFFLSNHMLPLSSRAYFNFLFQRERRKKEMLEKEKEKTKLEKEEAELAKLRAQMRRKRRRPKKRKKARRRRRKRIPR